MSGDSEPHVGDGIWEYSDPMPRGEQEGRQGGRDESSREKLSDPRRLCSSHVFDGMAMAMTRADQAGMSALSIHPPVAAIRRST
jgi:hypothetical protein